jgi:hypothetical protein
VVKGLIRSQVKDGLPSHTHNSQVYGDSPLRHLQGTSRRKKVLLTQLRGGRCLLLGETRKRVKGMDATCPHCGEEDEDLEHVLRACPKLESPRRRNFVRVPRRSRLCRWSRRKRRNFFGRSTIGVFRNLYCPNNNNPNFHLTRPSI